MSNVKKVMHAIAEAMGDDCEKNIEKTVPFKKEWRESYKEMEEATLVMKVAMRKKEIAKEKFWTMVEEDLGTYANNMHYNSETDEIEIESAD